MSKEPDKSLDDMLYTGVVAQQKLMEKAIELKQKMED